AVPRAHGGARVPRAGARRAGRRGRARRPARRPPSARPQAHVGAQRVGPRGADRLACRAALPGERRVAARGAPRHRAHAPDPGAPGLDRAADRRRSGVRARRRRRAARRARPGAARAARAPARLRPSAQRRAHALRGRAAGRSRGRARGARGARGRRGEAMSGAGGWLTHPLLAAQGVAHGFGTRAATPPAALVRPRQVHGARVVVLTEAGALPEALGEADAVVSERASLPIGVVTADCLPILVATPAGRVAAVHAGWRGLAAGVIARALEALGGLAPE